MTQWASDAVFTCLDPPKTTRAALLRAFDLRSRHVRTLAIQRPSFESQSCALLYAKPCMSVLHLSFCLPSPNVALTRPTLAFLKATMLSRAISTHASSNRPKVQQPLALNNSAGNVQRPAPAPALNAPPKRKFDR